MPKITTAGVGWQEDKTKDPIKGRSDELGAERRTKDNSK